MKKISLMLLIMLLINACTTPKKSITTSQKDSPELTSNELKKLEYIAPIKKYKSRYIEWIPYLYNNVKGDYNKRISDFYNIKVKGFSNLNMTCSYYENAEKRNVLRVMLRKSSTSKNNIFKSNIHVVSKKHGKLSEYQRKGGTHPWILFIKEIQLDKANDIIHKIKNDTITITINGEQFEFISPEFD
ncbi:MAG: hypothetical protein JKY69_00335 [Flavobacteriaceae bacterium]|nr:hypothetical protein [Flavobacteriaceae bacterium]